MKRSRCLIALVVFASWAFLVDVQPALSEPALHNKSATTFPVIHYEKYTLKNGLDVILSEDHHVPRVAVNLFYHVGPANERPGRTGFAHLFEHMMFEGSKHVGAKAHFQYLEAAGADDVNATTEFDRTEYHEALPSNQLELALWLESDRMAYLLDTLDREKLENQRDVVRNERRQSVENAPYGLVEEGLYHTLFPKDHPYYASVIGSHADIESARLADVRDFFHQYYSPNNASLAIVGDFDRKQVHALVEKYFGSIPAGPRVPVIQVRTPPITEERRVTVTDKVELPRLYMGWITPSVYTTGDAETRLLAQILGGGKSSRLYQKLVYEKQIAQDAEAVSESLLLGSVFVVQVTAKPGVKFEDLEEAVNHEIEDLQDKGPTAEELDRARNSIQSRVIRSLEELGGVAYRLNYYDQYVHDPGYLAKDLGRYDRVSILDLQKAAQKELEKKSRVVVYGAPGEKVLNDVPKVSREQEENEEKNKAGAVHTASMPDESWRSKAPKPGPSPTFALPVPTSFKLSNGLTVLVAERHGLPVISARVVVLSGSAANPAETPGLASFTAAMLEEGTKKRSALKLATDAEQIGASFDTGSEVDSSAVSIQTLKQNLDPALDILSDVVLDPTFEAKEVERIRKERITSILQEQDEPSLLARKAVYRTLYGPENPYGYLEIGTENSNQKISRDDLMGFWQHEYVPQNSALILAGDITVAEARTLATRLFGEWTGSVAVHSPISQSSTLPGTMFLVDKPGTAQTQVRVAALGVPRSNPDYVPLRVMNTVLGGLFSSRLNMNLRERHGYTYGVSSAFVFRRDGGYFSSGGGIRSDATAPAIKEILSEIERMRGTSLSPSELALGQNALSLSLPALFETSSETSETLSRMFTYNLPLDYYRKLPGQINAVNAVDVQRVASKYLQPTSLIVVAVGDRSKIEEPLKQLNLGEIEVIR